MEKYRMFLPSLQVLAQLEATLALFVLATSYVKSSTQGSVELLIQRRDLETVGLALGAIYLVYVVILFSAKLIV
jgi:hypothetical protein